LYGISRLLFSYSQVAISGIISAISALALFRSFITSLRQSQSKISSVPIYMGIFYLVLSSLCVWATNAHQQISTVKSLSQTAGWFVMLTSLTVALLTEPLLLPRLLALSIALQSMYLLLSLSYEGLFLLCLVSTDEDSWPVTFCLQDTRKYA
jgi:hypothetical protein